MNRTYCSPRAEDITAWVTDYQERSDDPSSGEVSQIIPACAEKTFHKAPAASAGTASNLFVSEDEILFFTPQVIKKNLWSIAWSDLMMTMFIYFALLYIFTAGKSHRSEAPSHPPASSIKQVAASNGVTDKARLTEDPPSISHLYAFSKKTVETEQLRHLASVELVPDKAVKIILTSDLLFDLGKAELKHKARQQLQALAPLIRESPYLINVVGHTDDIPIRSQSFSSNWELSVIRACVVARFFIDEMGIRENKFYLSGHSSLQPAKPNSSEENRAANRRVELIITKDRPLGAPLTDETAPGDLQ